MRSEWDANHQLAVDRCAENLGRTGGVWPIESILEDEAMLEDYMCDHLGRFTVDERYE